MRYSILHRVCARRIVRAQGYIPPQIYHFDSQRPIHRVYARHHRVVGSWTKIIKKRADIVSHFVPLPTPPNYTRFTL